MKKIYNHNYFNSHPSPNKKSLSVSLLIITILLSACGGTSSENSATTKESAAKVVPKKESKDDEIKEEQPLNIPPSPKLPYSKEDMLAIFDTIKIADPSSIVDTTAKDKEEFQIKMKEKVEKEIIKVIDACIKDGEESLPTEIAKLRKSINDAFDTFLKDKDENWTTKPVGYATPESKKDFKSELAEIMRYLDDLYTMFDLADKVSFRRCTIVGLKTSVIEDCVKLQIKRDEIIKNIKPKASCHKMILENFVEYKYPLDGNYGFGFMSGSDILSVYQDAFVVAGGKADTFKNLQKEKEKFFMREMPNNKFILNAKRVFLEKLIVIHNETKRSIENNLACKAEHTFLLTKLSIKEDIYVHYQGDIFHYIINGVQRYGEELKECLNLSKTVDLEPAKKLYSIHEMIAKNEQAIEKLRVENLTAKAEKIRSSKNYKDIDTYEMALKVFPLTLDGSSLRQTRDLSTLKGNIFELNTGKCIQSLGDGRALMVLDFFEMPILIEALNSTFANTVYVNNYRYRILVKFTGTTSYKNLLGAEAQAVKAQVIYIKQ